MESFLQVGLSDYSKLSICIVCLLPGSNLHASANMVPLVLPIPMGTTIAQAMFPGGPSIGRGFNGKNEKEFKGFRV